jgi:uncharacterized membrane protein YoaK (UPF0700 family)
MARLPGTRVDGWLLVGLCLLTGATGVLDATSFLDLGRTFTANMTGNVLLLAFSLTGTSLGGGADSQGFLIALVGFVVGALAGSAAAGRRGRRAHLHFGLAMELVALAVALVVALGGPVDAAGRRDVLIALLAFGMGVQNATVRRMGITEANTTVLTTSLGSLAADVVAFGVPTPRAGRRTATVTCIFGGAVLGALLQKHGVEWPLAVAMVLVVLGAAAIGGAGWPAPDD